ncbi:S1 family peptidase [Promicromonospora thailandica]|uniref:Streptogrisin B n=1 Tax=Promicromonospora thailandica TaxID=765201 RepID=A0A9X2G7C6_9MICO|nr:S1 family peptidase [Promicromonospora thailandica]MCP2266923.1 streptogrisin B [Promicromonospora thailandica]
MRHTPRPENRPARRARLTAVVAGLALSVSAVSTLAGPPSSARPDGPTAAELGQVSAAVDATGVDNIAWYTDDERGTVVVTVGSPVSAADRDRLRDAAGGTPDAVTIREAPGPLRPALGSGDAIHGPDYRCSVGFNVHTARKDYLLTAGHCGDEVGTWYADEGLTVLVGPTVDAKYPGNDYALVRYENDSMQRPGGFSAGKAHVGQEATRNGSTTGKHWGKVTALDVTVKYEGGDTMYGMIQTDICTEPGDSGGPLYSGTTGLGITSGGSGDCASGGVSFHQPLLEALKDHGVRLN